MNFPSNLNQWRSFLSLGFGILLLSLASFGSSWAQTSISGKVLTSDGTVVASGAVALEKGELHNNAFLAGGAVRADGSFKIPLPSGGTWGLHVYSENYIYFPLQVQITEGIDNEVPVILPVDGTTEDDPKISDITFKKVSDQAFRITMRVDDPNRNLGPQMLAIDTKRYRSYRLVPEAGDLKDVKADFPAGVYVSPDIALALDKEDLKDWLFVVADHQCSNGAILNGFGESIFKPVSAHAETLACEVPGIWKSNFDKVYSFSRTPSGELAGEQFEGNLVIDKMEQQEDELNLGFRFEGQSGTAQLRLECRENAVILEGKYQYPGRSGDWMFTKLKNAKTALLGEASFKANCAVCHYTDRKDKKVGPGLLGIFKAPELPATGLPVTEENVANRIKRGGDAMPAFSHLEDGEIQAIVDYLKTL